MAQENMEEKDFGETFFEWEIPEFPEHTRSYLWYAGMFFLVGVFIIYSIFTENFLFALIIILFVFIIFLRIYVKPRKLQFKITEDGILLGNQFFNYRNIENFYFIYDPPEVKKLFFTLKGFAPDFSVPLDDMNPVVIREKLLDYIDEDLDRDNQSLDDQLETILKL